MRGNFKAFHLAIFTRITHFPAQELTQLFYQLHILCIYSNYTFRGQEIPLVDGMYTFGLRTPLLPVPLYTPPATGEEGYDDILYPRDPPTNSF